MKVENAVNPLEHVGKPLWCIYGSDAWPSMICCRLKDYGPKEGVAIWGYSIWKRQAGFRTLGIKVEDWMARHKSFCHFFADQQHAMSFLTKITKPKESAL